MWDDTHLFIVHGDCDRDGGGDDDKDEEENGDGVCGLAPRCYYA